MMISCREQAYPGPEPELFPAAQNKVSLTHTPGASVFPSIKGAYSGELSLPAFHQGRHVGGLCPVKPGTDALRGRKG